MRYSVNSFIKGMTALLIVAFVSACSMTDEKDMSGEKPGTTTATVAPMEIYEVHHDGRIHVFYDHKLYSDFLELGESPFRLTRIGAGPNGETLVFGLTGADKKKPDGVNAIKLYDGKMNAPDNFYAEMRKDNRIYIFSQFEDMKPVRDFGAPNYMFTEIGAGPKGETVVYVLNKSNKKKRPDALIAKHQSMHN